MILGIETSCDETAAALLSPEGECLAAKVQSQVDIHARFGGVVPDIAGRSHVEQMHPVLEATFAEAGARPADLKAVAVTHKPGLIGSLLVGVSAAKAIALAQRIPLVAVDHVEAHVYSCFHDQPNPQFPTACLVASGGHSTLFEVANWTEYHRRGETIDDAAGEAFDKVGAILGLPYPGGPIIDRLAQEGDPKKFPFPRSMMKKDSLDFSFSGLKTAVLYHCRGKTGREPRELSPEEVRDVAASFQEAVVDVLLAKLRRVQQRFSAQALAIGGGVAANGRLRARATELAANENLPLYLAPRELTTDNAVMVAGLGRLLWREGKTVGLDLDAIPSGGD